jgi:outer membrane protein assembly factor BamB
MFVAAPAAIWAQNAPQPNPAAVQAASANLVQSIGPFIEKNCQTCHNAGLPSGNVDLAALLSAPNSLPDRRELWNNVAYQIRSGFMPPEGVPKPPKADADAALALIAKGIAALPRTNEPDPRRKVSEEGPATLDWLTYNYDSERTGWARGEKKITKATAPNLQLKWRLQTETQPMSPNRYASMTDAVVVNNVPTKDGPKKVVYVGSHDDTLYAIDADKGTIIWKRSYPNTQSPRVAASGNCPNNMNATPYVDLRTGTIYFLPNDGKMRGVSITDGEDKFPATEVVPPYTRNFSLNMADGWLFTSTTRGCQQEVSEIVGIGVDDPKHPISHFYLSQGKGSGVWGRGGLVKTPWGMLGQTADGAYDPAGGRWGSSVVGLTYTGRLVDSWTPPDQAELDARDLELGSSSPVVFPYGNKVLVALAAKEGKIYLLDAQKLGGNDHRTNLYTSQRWSNDATEFGYAGMWSVISTYKDKQGRRWIFAPFYGPPAKGTPELFKKVHGNPVNGEVMAFTVEGPADKPYLVPQWMSDDMDLPGEAVIMNDVMLICANGDRASTQLPGGRGGRGGNANANAGDGGDGAPGPGRGGAGGRGGGAAAGGGNAAGGQGPGRGGLPTRIPVGQYDPNLPGADSDRAWLASQFRPFEDGGQKGGTRKSGGRDTTHAILYALDPETGDEVYSSGNTIDSWNHYGGIAVADGEVFLSSYDGRIYAFSLKK